MKLITRCGIFSLLLTLLLTHPCSADGTPPTKALEEMVVTTSKMDTKPEYMTDAVTLIDYEDIKRQSFTDMTEVMRLSPSIEFKQAGGPGQFNYPKMRGYGQGHYLVLVNGMKINEAYNAGVGNFLGHLDTQLLDSVEVLRGPQAALYGSDTTAGVMAFNTLKGALGIQANAGVELGSLDWKKAYASLRGGSGNFTYAVGAAYTDSGGVHDDEYYDNFSPTFSIGWHNGPLDIELSYIYIDSEFSAAQLKQNNSFMTSRDENWAFQTPDPNNANKYEHHIATAKIAHEINDAFRQKMILGLLDKKQSRNDEDDGLLGYETSPFDNFSFGGNTYSKGDMVPVYDDGTGVAYGNDHKNMMVDYNLIWDAHCTEHSDNSLLFGVEYMYQEGGKWGRYGDLKNELDNLSFYLNDHFSYRMGKNLLILTAGIRRDDHEEFGGETTGKVGTAFTFTAAGTTLFANYGTSFRAPTIFNLYDAVYGNDGLKPETGWTVEAGVRQSFFNDRVGLEMTCWFSELDDVIVFDYSIPNPNSSVESGKYANRDSAETKGIELVFGVELTQSLRLDANYTYTDSHSDKGGESFRTVQIARNKGSMTLTYENEDLTLGITGYYSGPRLRWKGDLEMDEYVRVDLFGRYNILDNLALYSRVENLFDESIEEGLGYEQPGIYAIVGLEWTL